MVAIRFSCVLSLAVFALAGPASGQTDLRWRLVPDERLHLVLSQSATTEADIGGQTHRSSLRVDADLTWRVAEVGAMGVAVIDQTLVRLRLAAALPGREPVQYDSDAPPPAALAVDEELRPYVGQPVRLTLTPQGRLGDAGALPVAPKAASTPRSSAVPNAPREIRLMLDRLLPRLPPRAVSPGQTWQDVSHSETPHGRVRIDSQWVYRGQQTLRGLSFAKIEATYAFFTQGAERGVSLAFRDQNHAAEFHFDATAGRLAYGAVRQAATMQLTAAESQVEQKWRSEMQIEVRPAE